MKRVLIGLLIAVCCGCGLHPLMFRVPKGIYYPEKTNPPPGKALAYFIRAKESYGIVRGTLVQVDDDFTGILARATFCYRFLEPGEHQAYVWQITGDPKFLISLEFGNKYEIRVEANQTYYFLLQEDSWLSRVRLETIDTREGKRKIDKFRISGYSNHEDEWAYRERTIEYDEVGTKHIRGPHIAPVGKD